MAEDTPQAPVDTTPEPKKPILHGSNYDQIKNIAQVWLPAIGTLYFTLAQIWGLGYGEEVSGTILALDTFLGVVLKISSTQYAAIKAVEDQPAGFLHATGFDDLSGNPDVQLTITKDPNEIIKGDTVRFKVGPPPANP